MGSSALGRRAYQERMVTSKSQTEISQVSRQCYIGRKVLSKHSRSTIWPYCANMYQGRLNCLMRYGEARSKAKEPVALSRAYQ